MAIHLQASTRTRGGAVDSRRSTVTRNSIFPINPAVTAVRRMRARVSSVYPLTVVGALCSIALLILVRPDGSQRPDAGILAGTTHRRAAGSSAVGMHERLNGQTSSADPSVMLARAFALEKGSERDALVRELLSGWASRDAEAALNWVSSLEDPSARHSARSIVCLTVAEKNPRHAVELALAHGADEDDDGGLLECLAMQWCEKESDTVLDWAFTQPQGEWRNRLVARASFVLSKSDPVAAAHLVSGLEPGILQDEAAMAVLHQWALKDSSAALEWAEEFSESALRERALAEISNLRSGIAAHEAD